MNIDLHCHSTNSDGTWSVDEILREAERKGVKVLSITDHDNFAGSLEAFSKHNEVYTGELIPGIEISTTIEGRKIHLLAYFPTFDLPENAEILENLEKIRDSRVWRMNKMIERANTLGFDITMEEVLLEAGTGITGDKQPTDVLSRPHLARVMLKKRYVKDFDEAFDNYLADGKPLHVERFTLKFNEWIDQIHELGGLVIWAHPLHGHEENRESLLHVNHLLCGTTLDGIERVYNYKGKYRVSDEFEQWGSQELDRIIQEQGWLITAGGDFHGNVGKLGELDLDVEHWYRFRDRLFGDD